MEEEDWNELFDDMDADKSGYVDYREFCRAAYDRKMLLVDQNLEYAFKAIDEDKSG